MPLRVLALVPYPLGIAPAQRYRIEQWAPHLKARGIEVTFEPYASEATRAVLFQSGHVARKAALVIRDALAQVTRVLSPRSHDVVLVCREASLIGPAWYERFASWQRPLVFDFDDAVWLPQEGSVNQNWSFLRTHGKSASLCRIATNVVAGNAYLAEYGRRYSERVQIVPSTVDLAVYGAPRTHSNASTPVIGWIGSHSTVEYLQARLPALAAASRRRRFRLLVVGASIASVPDLDVECRPWRAATEANDLREMDLGLMPLPDNEWSRGKCAMKAIQYLAMGIPVIASPVGAALDVVVPGETGLLAASDEEWTDRVLRLLENAEERNRAGRVGRMLVEKTYAAEVQAQRFGDVLTDACNEAR